MEIANTALLETALIVAGVLFLAAVAGGVGRKVEQRSHSRARDSRWSGGY